MQAMPDRIPELRLARALVETVGTVADDFDVDRHLRRVSQLCTELLDTLAAGVMYTNAEDTVRIAVSHRGEELARGLLEAQHLGGPCIDCFGTGKPVGPVRLASRDAVARWPEFSARARAQGVGLAFAVALRARGRVFGVLNVFAAEWWPHGVPGAPEADGGRVAAPQESGRSSALGLAEALADAAAAGLHNQRAYAEYRDLSRQLQAALSSRIRIEQAKGILAERWQTGTDAAFGAMRRYARRERLIMDTVAGMVIQGDLDDTSLRDGHAPPP
ncbi:ANTAR domain-containing protein [Streptomyces sp. AN091965]|uniref:ANTAR domain-containing protein n=1 Tax=Streptomyces sp. AN091965 TaxID=2927803 RepID=UPI001F61AC25|nr:ANTAR domain-containing protein [Streptomyces sp. AN091965]MCI3930893.1 ANTAR domain-containing protein [Streptomyces sp. AN091965]